MCAIILQNRYLFPLTTNEETLQHVRAHIFTLRVMTLSAKQHLKKADKSIGYILLDSPSYKMSAQIDLGFRYTHSIQLLLCT